MDKKNTMLLTVIAVATLLVAVVGATFAYFSVSTTNSSQTVNVTGQTTAVGAATLTTPVTAMHLNLTGAEMAYDAIGAEYFSATGDDQYLTSAEPVEIAKMHVEGGDDTVSYTCNYSLTIAKNDDDTMITKLKSGDGKIVLGGNSITGIKEHDLITVTTSGVTVSGVVTNLTNAADEVVTAYAQINNTEGVQEFANTKLSVKITASTFSCTINE